MENKRIVFIIDEVLKEKNFSKNWLQEKANLQRSQLNSYANNKVKRIDLEVLARICTALDVEIGDIMKCQSLNGGNQNEN
ncbi:helix-turn-helix domain-containing protein [Clostridium tyrobutyricum]|jgi:putative transcriptional regulator|uniref:helix-turn-helix domain-containing protein n=1 Tax=Clostridium tyrobutyricum TaxID=1519 RepID=UPI00241C85D2|nr:helix-turn-helix transcriptional regulator [Clostridium tyrobutyricum]